MLKLKRSDSIWKCLQMFTQNTSKYGNLQICSGSGNNSWNLCAKWVTWSCCLMLHGKSYCFCFIVCFFCQKTNVRKKAVISVAVADFLAVFCRFMYFCKQFLRFPFMPACYCIQLKPWLAQNLWTKRGTVAVRSQNCQHEIWKLWIDLSMCMSMEASPYLNVAGMSSLKRTTRFQLIHQMDKQDI